jgi:hypothetical protein
MKSRKIQRLELISDNIQAGDSKGKVVCIRFDDPPKKNGLLVGAVHGRALMTRVVAPWPTMGGHWRAKGRGRRGEERGAAP